VEMRLRSGRHRLIGISRSNRLHAGQRVGFVESEGVSVEVFPKWMVQGMKGLAHTDRAALVQDARQSLAHLLDWCGVISITPGPAARQRAAKTSLSEWILHAMARELVHGLARGINRGYQERQEPLTAVRGRIDIGAQIRMGKDLPLPLWCRYEEHTQDTPLGRCLALFASLLSRLARSQATRNLAIQASRLLAPTTPTQNAPRDLARIRWTRSNERFQSSIESLKLLLAHQAVMQARGDAPSWSWSVPLSGVFERYVGRLLLLLWRMGLQSEDSKFPRRFTQRRIGKLTVAPATFGQKPDFVMVGDDRCAIIDTKYKVPRDFKPSESDVRQVLTYASLWNRRREAERAPCKRVILLYPAVDDEIPTTLKTWESYLNTPDNSNERVELHASSIPFRGVPTNDELKTYRRIIASWLN